MTAVNLMGAMTEDSGRGREETLFINHQPLILKEGKGGGGCSSPPSSSQPPSSSASLSMIVVCLLACFFICSYFLPPVHIIFFAISLPFCLFPMIEYLTMQQFPHFISSLSLSVSLFLSRSIVAERCEAGAPRKAEEGRN